MEQLNNETRIYSGDDHSSYLAIRIDGKWGIYDTTKGFIPLGIDQGGTGAGDAAGARTNLGLGNSSTKNTGTTANTVAAGDDARITGAMQKSQNGADIQDVAKFLRNLRPRAHYTTDGCIVIYHQAFKFSKHRASLYAPSMPQY